MEGTGNVEVRKYEPSPGEHPLEESNFLWGFFMAIVSLVFGGH